MSVPCSAQYDHAYEQAGRSLRERIPRWPIADEREEAALRRVLDSRQWWRGIGTEGDAFEAEFAALLGVRHARLVSSGTGALEIALQALDIGPGDQVAVPACTFISTAISVLRLGAWPIPVDVDRETLCLDPDAFAAAVNPKMRAVVPVHMAGQAADMGRIMEIAAANDIRVIEDAAHAHGASLYGRPLGSLGDVSIFSFQAGKLMTAGEGGLVATNDARVAERTFALHSCGRPKGDVEYRHVEVAGNHRASEFVAAILRVQLERMPDLLARRERGAATFDRLMRTIPGVTPLSRRQGVTAHSHYMAMAWCAPEAFGDRNAGEIALALRERGVPAYRCFPPVHRTEAFSPQALRVVTRGVAPPDYDGFETPVSDEAARSVVWFHHSILLGDDALLEEIVDQVRALTT